MAHFGFFCSNLGQTRIFNKIKCTKRNRYLWCYTYKKVEKVIISIFMETLGQIYNSSIFNIYDTLPASKKIRKSLWVYFKEKIKWPFLSFLPQFRTKENLYKNHCSVLFSVHVLVLSRKKLKNLINGFCKEFCGQPLPIFPQFLGTRIVLKIRLCNIFFINCTEKMCAKFQKVNNTWFLSQTDWRTEIKFVKKENESKLYNGQN